MLQILYLQPICRRYLQRSNYLSIVSTHCMAVPFSILCSGVYSISLSNN
ncbi:hypothetical protein GPL11_19445 [Bacteroides xylanisolvens]|nr:hypothetical protein [Bacteroides xylanisolvens]